MKPVLVYLATLFLTLITGPSSGARILGIIPIPSYSHQIAYQALWKTLSQRGHEVFLVTANPISDTNLKNLTQFGIEEGYELIKPLNFLQDRLTSTWVDIVTNYILKMGEPLSELVYSHPEFKKVYAPDSGQKFDVVIVEAIITPGCYALAHRFDAPLIGTYSLGLMQHFNYVIGNPVLSSHPSNWELGKNVGLNLPFWKRLKNFVTMWTHLFTEYGENYYGLQQKVANKYLGNVPSVKEMEKNMSLVLVNQQDEISYARPYVPNVITFGSLHVSDNVKPLPKDLKEFVDSSPNGFVYVSFGTNVQTAAFSKELKSIFFDVLSNLPLKVVWKFKGDLPKSSNIYTAEWFSQQSILAHPNIKLFVYQGGLQSTEEAVHFGVPLVGLPVLADQDMQISKMVSLGVCRFVEILELTKETLDEAIRDVLTDKRYKENMTRLHNLIKDKPRSHMENVIWWIEYVIRNKGAPHLRSTIADEPWYQRYDVDIIAFLSIILFMTLVFSLYVAYKILLVIAKYYATSVTSEKQKVDKLYSELSRGKIYEKKRKKRVGRNTTRKIVLYKRGREKEEKQDDDDEKEEVEVEAETM
ncbi:hypothetical protein KPH14_005858 [Odynerus spinipes]|uniref:UDP-glycosyltransferase n=1 Tax=Odynerus spinipes TaxID=1348599 RepID=A0AAD9RBD4_9HYME|nr:hypothetical protein KPH14_005858 [Odynerus spinipes]